MAGASSDTGKKMAAGVGYGNVVIAQKSEPLSRLSPEMLIQLKEIDLKRENTNAENATVTMEEPGEAPVKPKSKPDSENKEHNYLMQDQHTVDSSGVGVIYSFW